MEAKVSDGKYDAGPNSNEAKHWYSWQYQNN
jgi:hypothetical protein